MLTAIARQAFRLLPSTLQQSVREKRRESKARRLQRELESIGVTATQEMLDINHVLHHLRGQALQNLPKGAGHFVSVGCAGTWYFNWIEEMCHPRHHTGIEYYMPRPNDLPPNVTWIANTAGNMHEIGDGVADLLFSGQNIEHLWSEDISRFLLESHRVLKENGLLVIDSPNRRITARLQWSQPEHTVEFNVDEILELLDLAGFDVEKKFGIWLCEDPATGKLLPLEDLHGDGPWPVSRRVNAAVKNLSSSFIWWVEARKASRAPQVRRLQERVSEIYRLAWQERLDRLKTVVGREYARSREVWLDSDSKGGPLLFGPYAPLCPGNYTVTFYLSFPERPAPDKEVVGICDVVAGNGTVQIARHDVTGGQAISNEVVAVSVPFSVQDTVFGVEFRVMAEPGVRTQVKKSITLERLEDKANSSQ